MKQLNPGKDETVAMLIPKIGRFFEGQPYVAHALKSPIKSIIINLRELDCTTYAEHLLAVKNIKV